MNKNETIVKEKLEKLGHSVKRIAETQSLPDFLVDNNFYVEVKCLDYYNTSILSNNQEIKFSGLDKKIYVVFVKNEKVVDKQIFEPLSIDKLPKQTKTINVTFEDEEYKQLIKTKNSKNWHDFILGKVKEVNQNETI